MTKLRKTYIAVLIVAMIALAWDKSTNSNSLTQPQLSQAQTQSRHNVPVVSAFAQPPQTLNPPATARPISPLDSLCQKIQSTLPSSTTPETATGHDRDIFVASEQLLRAMDVPQQTDAAEEKTIPAEQMAPLNLSAIVFAPPQSYTIINEQILKSGQNIGPYHLTEIKSDAVVLQVGSEQITLNYDR